LSDTIRVLFVDDHAIVREGLRALLATQPDMQIVGEAADGVEAVSLARALHPDVILLDLIMPRMDGATAIAEIKRNDHRARILVLTSFAADDNVFPAIKAGALGYLLKDSTPQLLLQAIRDVYHGNSSLHPAIALKVIRELNHPSVALGAEEQLTERELEILRLVARGLTNRQIAERLIIAERTVSTHITSILDKLHVANRVQATLYAMREGLAVL
jgi:two-component system, NarL family, response regulator LiaR